MKLTGGNNNLLVIFCGIMMISAFVIYAIQHFGDEKMVVQYIVVELEKFPEWHLCVEAFKDDENYNSVMRGDILVRCLSLDTHAKLLQVDNEVIQIGGAGSTVHVTNQGSELDVLVGGGFIVVRDYQLKKSYYFLYEEYSPLYCVLEESDISFPE